MRDALVGTFLIQSALALSSLHPSIHKKVSLRPFPYPYQAMLAIESDADHVNLRKFNIIHEFLNTTMHTPLGKGLGLDISDSFFLYNGSNLPDVIDYNGAKLPTEMTFFRGTIHKLAYGSILLHYMRVGWIDTFHAMGDFSRINTKQTVFSRNLAVYALRYLEAHGIHLTVITDHGNQSNVDNFGAYSINRFEHYQQGDSPESPYYITDLLHQAGVRFVWPDLFSQKYAYPSMIYPIHLRDGREIWGFWRFTGTLRKVLKHHLWRYDWTDLWNPAELSMQLSPARLSLLVHDHAYTIIATHLEGNADKMPLSTSAVEALTRLSHLQYHGKILVARTSRLLQYNLVHQYLRYKTYQKLGQTWINILAVADPVDGAFVPSLNQLHGITFSVPDPLRTIILLRGTKIPATDETRSVGSIGVRWFSPDTTNYAIWSLKKRHTRSSVKKGSPTMLAALMDGFLVIGLILTLLYARRRSKHQDR